MSYTAVVLDEKSHGLLLKHFAFPDGWEPIAHHMTTNLGSAAKGPAADLLGQEAELTVVAVAKDNKVMAVQVETKVPSINAIKHVTIAVNRAGGGKPFDSNKLTDWSPVEPFKIKGVVAEV